MQIIYGVNPVIECLKAKRRSIRKILVHRKEIPEEIISECSTRNIKIRTVSREEINRIAGRDVVHQGIVAEVSPYPYLKEKKLNTIEERLIAFLDGIEDPMNLGAILRSSYALGINTIILPQKRCVHITSAVVKASAGAVEWLKICIVKTPLKILKLLKAKGYSVCSLDISGKITLERFHPPSKAIIITGGEGRGISKSLLMHSDYVIRINTKITLNASVAFALAVHHILLSD